MMSYRLPRRFFMSLLGLWWLAGPAVASDDALLVFAAASLKNALDAATAQFSAEQGVAVDVAYGSSGTLARQLEQGAPADLFISASTDWMDYLQQRGLIVPETRVDLFGNELVLIAPQASTAAPTIAVGAELSAALGDGWLAVGDPAHVPAGIYARAALQHLGLWSALSSRLARADNVRSALALVARGEAPLGIVYGSDARAEPEVRVVATFPADSHPPIRYPAAQVAGREATAPVGAALLAFLRAPARRALFAEHGFRLLN